MNLSIGFSTVKFHMRVKGLQTPNEFFDELVKSQKRLFLSFPRESSKINEFWTPAFAGVTVSGTFYEAVIFVFWNFLFIRIRLFPQQSSGGSFFRSSGSIEGGMKPFQSNPFRAGSDRY